ncbi:importin-13 [Leptopilina boulardi]|uniref:importin-13 n=1 Tax=Leptopilina boulardi TaxID=63433 RepID=UPI0021F509F9|nr:importin-13 [Leptopilina boulardi]XP_051172124.1 importin-13 [Leptopilina boulardi]
MDNATIVESAVNRFFSAGENEAHVWLLQVQDSPEAWSFVWELLVPTKSKEVQFFAANTLHSKISQQWTEVPCEEYLALQHRLLTVMKQLNASNLVLSKLCQALAAFLINLNKTKQEEREKGLVGSLIEILPPDSLETIEFHLRVLSYLPKEFERRNELKGPKRDIIVSNWSKTTWILQQVFTTLDQSASSNNSKLYFLGLECLLSWLKLGQLPVETTAQIYPHLLTAAGRYLPNRDDLEEDHIKGWEIIQECLSMILTHTELHKRPQLFWEWSRSIVQTAREHGASYYYEILSTLGEANSRTLLLALANDSNEMQKWTAQQVVEILLECSEQPGRYPCDEKRSCIPFGFWYTFQDDLATLDQPVDSQATLALRPIYARLAQALLRKATLPLTSREAGDSDDRELLRCYRQDAADTLNYCHNVLKEDLLLLLGQRLSQPFEEVENWTHVESSLHAFNALADNVGTQESQYVPALMNIIFSYIPYEKYPGEVLACACTTIGAYAEWFGEHPTPWLERSLKLITLGLSQSSVTILSASMALKDISRECSVQLAPLAPSILDTIGHSLPTIASVGVEGLRLMYAAGKLLNTLPTLEQQIFYLDATLGLCVTRLRDLLQNPVATSRVAVSNQLKMVTIFFSTLERSIGKTVLDGLLPIFKQIVAHPEWNKDDMTLEAMHSCAQKSLSSLPYPEDDAKPLLAILSMSYKIKPHPMALNLLRSFVLLFGRDPNNTVGPVFAELSSITLAGVVTCQSVGGNLSDLSDLLEAYLGLLAQICKKNATLLLQIPDQVPQMLKCGITCLLLPETGTTKAAGSFLTHAIMQSPHLQTFIQPVGQELVCVLLQCIAGSVPRNNLETHAEVLLSLNKMCTEWTSQWLRNALVEQAIPQIPQALKENLIRNILKERTSKRRLCETLKDFSLQCLQHNASNNLRSAIQI